MTVFVTGTTGFLGRYLAQGLLAQGEDLVLLVRGASRPHAEERAREALAWLDESLAKEVGGRVRVCPGDLDRPGLGLSPEDRALVIERCDSFLHCGASVRFDLPIEAARAVNVEGTRAVLDLARERARRGDLARIDHVSTCYVAGDRRDVVAEDELQDGVAHRNTYERTKFEAEHMIREAREELPIAVHRPSIVVGESDFGRTSNFNTLYWPLKIYAQGYWRTLPGSSSTPVDIVPVDFVRDALLALRRDPGTLGGTFHLAAGLDGATTIREVLALMHAHFPERRPVRVVDPGWWLRGAHPVLKRLSFGRFRRFLETLEVYIPYFLGNPRFDNTDARRFLAESGILAPSVASYFGRLVAYCVETGWGGDADPASH